MKRTSLFRILILTGVVAMSGCAAEVAGTEDDAADVGEADLAAMVDRFSSAIRTPLEGGLAQYTVILPVGPGSTERIRLQRIVRESAPWRPVTTRGAAVWMHGDFANFDTNFGGSRPSLATYLADRNIDVWGIDRRWTLLPSDATDLSSLTDQGYKVGLADTRIALAAIRAIRAATGQGNGGVVLGGFSRGAHFAYAYAGAEASRPRASRHVNAIVPIDIYARVDPAETQIIAGACARAEDQYAQIAAGTVESDNLFFSDLGAFAASAPDDPSPILPPYTNRGAFLWVAGQTYQFFRPTPLYHLAATVLEDGVSVSARLSPENRLTKWFAGAPRWQSLRESADGDALWCGTNPPIDDHIGDIRLPILYVGGKGGFGDYGRYTLTRTASTDARAIVVSAGGDVASDTGHGDLLFGRNAASESWAAIAAFVREQSR
ncbi:MAG: hypothetical protein ABW133_18445 [Polyangiaceae bacterium]